MPISPMWKMLKGTSMSRRHRWKCSALPMTLLGHGSVFQHLSCWRNASIRHPCTLPTTLLTRRHRKCQNSQRAHGAQPPKQLSSLLGAPGAKGQLGTVRGGQGAPSPSKFLFLNQKPCQHCQRALWRFLATLPAIGHIFAPNFDRAHHQGVY